MPAEPALKSGALDWIVLALTHAMLMLAVAMLLTIAALYFSSQPIRIPIAGAAAMALGMRWLSTPSLPEAFIRAVLLTLGALGLAQLLFWSTYLSAQVGAPVLEGFKRLTPDFLWVLSHVGMRWADWTELGVAVLGAGLFILPWRRRAA